MKNILFLIFLLCSMSLSAQSEQQAEKLSLTECINTALDNNIQIQQAENNLIVAKATRFQTIFNYLPRIGASGGYYIRNGNYFDNAVDRFITETTRSFSMGASASVVLFNGFNNKHSLQSAVHNFRSSEANLDGQKLDVEANVLSAYMNILMDKENLEVSSQRIDLLQAQYERAVKRESVGVGNLEDVYNFQSQVANEKLNNVNLSNQLQSDYLTLIQILQLDPSQKYQIEEFGDLDDVELTAIDSYSEVLSDALGFSPQLKSANSAFESARYDYYSAHSVFIPSISAYYAYGTGYSSNGAINPDNGQFEADADFTTQLGYNIQPNMGFEFNIPIFTRFNNRTTFQTAKVGMLNAQLDVESARVNITNIVQQVFQDLVAAQSTYRAAQENLLALEQSYEYAKKRYETGNTDFYTYLESLNNKNNAEIQLVNAKYGIIFRQKILDIYRGQESNE